MAAPEGNKNAEKWTFEDAEKLFKDAIQLSSEKYNPDRNNAEIEAYSYDFIGEVARELNTYHQVFRYLIEVFPELKVKHDILLNNLESNCFFNGKKGNIKEASAIMNLKSNHNWTDRQHIDLPKEINIPLIKFVKRGN